MTRFSCDRGEGDGGEGGVWGRCHVNRCMWRPAIRRILLHNLQQIFRSRGGKKTLFVSGTCIVELSGDTGLQPHNP